MTEKRFTYDEFEDCIIDNVTGKTHWGLDDILNDKLNEISDENEQLKQYKQSVRDILLSWSQKNLSAKQLQIVIAIMEELNVIGDVE